ncbi:MAG: outer membrane beta-barrel protein [Pseudomonadota bacterium]
MNPRNPLYRHTLAALCMSLVLGAGAAFALPEAKKDFSAHLSLEQEYVDCLQLSRGHGEEYISTISPGFSLSALTEASGCKLEYDLGWARYWRLNNNFVQHAAHGALWQQWEHLRFDAQGEFSRQEQNLELDPDTLTPKSIRDSVSPYYRAGASPTLSYEFGKDRSLSLGYNWATYYNDNPRFQDSEISSPEITLDYAFNPFHSARLFYAYERGDFSGGTALSHAPDYKAHRAGGSYTYRMTDHANLSAAYSLSDLDAHDGTGYRLHNAALGLDYAVADDLALGCKLGYYLMDQTYWKTTHLLPHVDWLHLADGNKSGPQIEGKLIKTFPKGTLTVTGQYGTGEDWGNAENLGIYEYWGGGVLASHALGQHLSASANAGYRRISYAQAERKDDNWSGGCGLSWTIRPWLTGALDYSHTDCQSDTGRWYSGQRWDFAVNTCLARLTAIYE